MNINYDKDGLLITNKHVFFFKNTCPFSNFYQPCRFLYTYFNEECHTFFSSEQAFMWHKAKTFDDEEVANKILFEGNLSPKFCKEQGRLVKNYDDDYWSQIRYEVMLEVNLEKFSQNPELKSFILDKRFDGKSFVEASPYDKIWGIKMCIEDDGVEDESNWKGQNLMGKVIGEVRGKLRNGY